MKIAIHEYCSDKTVPEPSSTSLPLVYNQGERYEIKISMNWKDGHSIPADMKLDCPKYLSQIMDGQFKPII